MTPTLILEAFGQLTPGTAVIVGEEEDLYSVFRARAELMSWCTTSAHPRPLLFDKGIPYNSTLKHQEARQFWM